MSAVALGPEVRQRPIDPIRLRSVIEFLFEDPSRTYQAAASLVGITDRHLRRWRKTEEWEAMYREVAVRHVSALTPHAIAALKRAWAAGRGEREALEVLRGAGLLSPAMQTITVQTPDASGLRAAVLARLAEIDQDHMRALPPAIDDD